MAESFTSMEVVVSYVYFEFVTFVIEEGEKCLCIHFLCTKDNYTMYNITSMQKNLKSKKKNPQTLQG